MNLKELRESKSLTQEDIAKELEVGRTTVAMWESGASAPRAALLPKIAKLLDCKIDDLFKDDSGETAKVTRDKGQVNAITDK